MSNGEIPVGTQKMHPTGGFCNMNFKRKPKIETVKSNSNTFYLPSILFIQKSTSLSFEKRNKIQKEMVYILQLLMKSEIDLVLHKRYILFHTIPNK